MDNDYKTAFMGNYMHESKEENLHAIRLMHYVNNKEYSV